jgi:hypothetical protein
MPIPLASHEPETQQTDAAELQEQIRSRAYEIYEQRNRAEGHDLDDWLQAEAELTGTKTQQSLDQWVAYDGWHCTTAAWQTRHIATTVLALRGAGLPASLSFYCDCARLTKPLQPCKTRDLETTRPAPA